MPNALIHETSPYLLQHAHNPVNWYPWGEEALAKAKAEDKPILVSIGYAACHWCHVMERESFEDESTAALMNEYFINIKIDREERPDLDHIYMDAVQAMSGSGGWPLNVFLTPDTKPFFGGTYFPPVRAYNRASWKEVLEGIHKSYVEKKNEIIAQAENLTAHLLSSNGFGIGKAGADVPFSEENLQVIAEGILLNADTEWGGFGKAPKFPQSFSIQYLLRHYHFTKQDAALKQALLSLDKMVDGGIYDQLGGGFARYSTDNEWLAPHFEKMLYDNALLVGVLAEAYQVTKNPKYADTIRQTLAFTEREMLSEEGGFYSALDADSEGVEGKFYVWGKAEIDDLLGADAPLFESFYDVSEQGNWEHVNILRILKPMDVFAAEQGLETAAVAQKLAAAREILFQQRSRRIRPQLDDKILLGWNALMNTAYAKACAALGDEAYREMAVRNMQFLESKFTLPNGSWHHTYKNGTARIPAFLDDYAYLIQSYINLQEITGSGEYLTKAEKLAAWVIEHFEEEETGFFFYTNKHQQDVIVRKKEVYDGAVPSGNAVMCHNLLYLSIVFDQPSWGEHAHRLLNLLNNAVTRYPGSFGVWAMARQLVTKGMVEIAIAGTHAKDALPALLAKFVPNKIVQTQETNSAFFPLLAGKTGVGEKTAFYLCKNYACQAPFLELETLLANV
ncbi:thioredoxin domain-containing protein [Sediminibacterium roseum]|uniref:Thioredoxin domain-containing protein n=1 Tax=Sediminibacterium roseum TaxID=1978412 RepID=A0ABW9ZNZ4_9BACT|nr:thioredoxin domain-containing protein [Sediminibacterium roseum]NCI48809.1 thioredoxin domain-containing protein [Sediminibacterium roseum]